MANVFTRKKDSGSSNALTRKSLEYTHKVPGPDKTEGQGTGYFGNYDVAYEQNFAWDDSSTESSKPRGTGSDSFFSFKKLFDQITRGSTDVSRKQGTITANYATTSDAEVTEASKKTCVQTDSSVKYHYSYVERQELDPITATTTTATTRSLRKRIPTRPYCPALLSCRPCRTQSRTPLFCLLTPLCPLCRTHMPCRRPA